MTLDIASLDPYSGEISFFKAGAAPCFIKRSGRTAILELPSLPAGILSRIGFSKAGAELREGDTVVMISDGVAADGSEWITKLIRSWRGDAQGLAEDIGAAKSLWSWWPEVVTFPYPFSCRAWQARAAAALSSPPAAS